MPLPVAHWTFLSHKTTSLSGLSVGHLCVLRAQQHACLIVRLGKCWLLGALKPECQAGPLGGRGGDTQPPGPQVCHHLVSQGDLCTRNSEFSCYTLSLISHELGGSHGAHLYLEPSQPGVTGSCAFKTHLRSSLCGAIEAGSPQTHIQLLPRFPPGKNTRAYWPMLVAIPS